MPMLLEDYPRSHPVAVRERSFDRFWSGSRFRGAIAGVEGKGFVKDALDEMVDTGGFYTCLECEMNGAAAGSLAVFRDPRYRSRRRDDVACFGFVTARDAAVLSALLDEAAVVARKAGCTALRGPVNVPRHFFGYGVLVSGYDKPVIAGTPANGEADAEPFLALDTGGHFDRIDRYFNLSQDFDKTLAYMATLGLDTSFRVVNPDLDALGDLPARVAGLMNDTLGYRADYTETDAGRLAAQAKAFKAVPGGERFMAFYYDGDVLAGGVLMHPDWFQVMRGEPATTVVGDIYMLAPAYQGRRLFLNFSEYSLRVLEARGTTFYEHASIHEGTTSIMATTKRGLTSIVREARVYERRV